MTDINTLPVEDSQVSHNELKAVNEIFKSDEEIAKVKKGLSEFKVILLGTVLFGLLTAINIKFIYKILAFAFLFSLIYIRFFN
jgi:hypothetical protein